MSSRKLLTAFVAASLLVALAIGATSAGTAWRDVTDTPAVKSPLAGRGLFNGLALAGTRVVAVGQRGHILYSDRRGEHWQQADVPVSSDLVAVSFAAPDVGWAVGHDGIVLKTADRGATWQRQLDGDQVAQLVARYYAARPLANPAVADQVRHIAANGGNNPLLDVWFADASNGFIVGAFGLILRTSDGGATWEPWIHAVDNPKELHLYSVRGVGADVYVVGEQGLALRLDSQTQRFRKLNVPYEGTLFGIVGNKDAVVVHGLRGSLLRSVDGGQTWQPIPSSIQVGLTASTVASDGALLVASQAGHLLTSRDGGATFTLAAPQQMLPAAALVSAGGDSVVIGGPRGLRVQPLR
ncbi:MAG TPA: YCF48-related protein [Burkholderiaceae bacterium]|nr:YCF48-related protein [Burkholderiaceae bacterium]